MSRFFLVCGTAPRAGCSERQWERTEVLANMARATVRDLPKDSVVITGGAAGVDTEALSAATNAGLVAARFEAPWKLQGRKAGPMRNKAMVEMLPPGSTVLAFWDGFSKGTEHTITLAKKRGDLTVKVYKP